MARSAGMYPWWNGAEYAASQHGMIALAQIRGTPGDDDIHGRRAPDTVDGRGGDDTLNGRYGDDRLDGGNGNDVLKGSTGRDILEGGSGNDALYGGTFGQEGGGAGRDHLDGGSGDDRLYGGFETDVLTGGPGRDRFTYLDLSDATVQHPDVILDFEQSKDKLVFRDGFRDSGNLHFIGDAEFSQTPGEVRFELAGGQTEVMADIDGDGITDVRIAFTTAEIQFQASDFSF